MCPSLPLIQQHISTHTLTWSVTCTFLPISTSFYFNSHAHVERDEVSVASVVVVADFNSHAHVERDFDSRSNSLVFHISTHTLTWSVTPQTIAQSYNHCISTHTLTWSVTFISVTEKRPCKFQLTRSRGA